MTLAPILQLYGPPAAFVAFVWWFSTGVILIANRRDPRTFAHSFVVATLLLGAALYGLGWSATRTGLGAAYLAFTCGLLVWGWQELSFFMGFITGPRPIPCPAGCSGWERFRRAVDASIHHELVALAAGVAVLGITRHAPNQVGAWTYWALWALRLSAKLNVFLGVRNLNEQFLPERLAFVASFLRAAPMNRLFPVSVSAATVGAGWLAASAAAAGEPVAATRLALLATIVALGALEHWMMMLPLPFAALWNWALRHGMAGGSAAAGRRCPLRVAAPPAPTALRP